MTDLLARTVLTPDGCREWQGVIDRAGYGRLASRLVHRLTWAEANGPIPPGMLVCHHCDNPPCVEPTHLFLGTNADNRRDSLAKGREWRKVPVERHPEILRRLAAGERQKVIAASLGVGREQIRRISAAYGWQLRNTETCPYHGVPKRTMRSGRSYCHLCVTERGRRRRLLQHGEKAIA